MNQDSLKSRKEYLNTLNKYLEDANKSAIKRRHTFFDFNVLMETPSYYRKRFVEKLGFPLSYPKTKSKLINKEFVCKIENIDIYRYTFLSLSTIKHFGLLFKCGDFEKTPFVIGCHGGGGTPEIVGSIEDSENYNDFIQRIVKKGANVFCPQFILWDKEKKEPKDYNRVYIDGKLKQIGGSITSLEMALVTSALDYFVENESISSSIGVAGMSYGGMYALFLAAYDTRYKSCLSSSFFNDRFKYSWSDWSYSNAANEFQDGEVACLVCPRNLFISVGDHDCMFTADTAENESNFVFECYKHFQKSENYKFEIFNGDHEFNKSDDFISLFVESLKV